MIYLDSAATYPILPCALDAFHAAPFGNPSSAHAAGETARAALEQARETIAHCIGARSAKEVYFTSGATEACNWAMQSMALCGVNFHISPYEHHAVQLGQTTEQARRFIGMKSNAYVQMLANNEVGEIYTLPSHEREDDLIFADVTAAVGHIPVNFHDLKADYMAFSAHKFGGIPGIGCLIVRENAPLFPMLVGGGQERGKRAGTESVALACAMAAALEWQTERMAKNAQTAEVMREILLTRIFEKIPDALLNLSGKNHFLSHILNVSFSGVDGKTLALLLSKEGVMVSAGAACTSGNNEPSHVLMAMYHDEARARSAIRISLSHQNTLEECEQAAKKIAECVAYLRSIGLTGGQNT